MARGRFLSESVAKDARLNSLSVEAELVYLMAIPHLDRDGLIDGDPDVLWGMVCPKRRQFIDTMPALIKEWTGAGLVTAYDGDEGPVLWFHGFAKNQVGLRYDREAPSAFPPPPGYIRDNNGLVAVEVDSLKSGESRSESAEPEHTDSPSADELRQNSGVTPEASGNCRPEVEVKDQDQVEEKGRERAAAPAASPPPVDDPPVALKPRTNRNGLVVHKSRHINKLHFDVQTGYVPVGTGATAVEVYYERFDIQRREEKLTFPQEDDLVRRCPDLDRLRRVIEAYDRAGFKNRRNLELIFDWYRDGIPAKHQQRKDQPHANRWHSSSVPAPADDTYVVTPEEDAELRAIFAARAGQSARAAAH